MQRSSSFPCRLCGPKGDLEAIDVSGAFCGVSGGTLCPACAELKRVDDKIQETAGLLRKLLEQRHELKFKRNHHHDQLTKRLPLELVSRIFAFCRPGFPFHDYKTQSGFPLRPDKEPSGITPWTLAVVCKSWRGIVWSAPQLWTSVSLNTALVLKKGYLKFAQEWLLRSGGLPLSLTIYEYGYNNKNYIGEKAAMEKALFDIINKSSQRWRALNVHLSDRQLKYLSGDSSGIWMLQDLRFEQSSESRYAIRETCVFRMHTTPSPKTVALHNVHFKSIEITWEHVAHVDLTSFAVVDCLEPFLHAHQMTHFTLHSTNRQRPLAPPPRQKIVHKHLRVLKIPASSYSLSSLFDCLILPSLEELHIPGYLPEAEALVARSDCRIIRLHVQMFRTEFDAENLLIALLERLPSLTDLTIFDVRISNAFFEKLGPFNASDPNREAFLPMLHSLEMRSAPRFQWECLADMFHSHPSALQPPRRALRSFKMNVNRNAGFPQPSAPPPEDVLLRLLAVCEGGVKMLITDGLGRDLLRVSWSGTD